MRKLLITAVGAALAGAVFSMPAQAFGAPGTTVHGCWPLAWWLPV